VNFTSLLLCISQNTLFFVKYFCSKIIRKPSIYKALSHFCVIITRASMRPAIPVAFIYEISLLYKFVLPVSVKQGDLYCEDLLFAAGVV